MGHVQGEILNRNFNQESKDTEKLLHLTQDNRPVSSERNEAGKVRTLLMF